VPSYSPVFSAPFVQYTPETPNFSFAVPDGYTAVIRQISCLQNIGGYAFACSISDSLESPELTIAYASGLGEFEVFLQEGRWVVPGGGFIVCALTTVGGSVSIYVGGYLLRNVLT
jgi:hypothetical protein